MPSAAPVPSSRSLIANLPGGLKRPRPSRQPRRPALVKSESNLSQLWVGSAGAGGAG